MKRPTIEAILLALLGCGGVQAQINSGSNGSDGAFRPTTDRTVVDMADHPDGIYHYTSVYIPSYVRVTFIPNANNTPVVWLVQSNVVIDGTIVLDGASGGSEPGLGGPGGWRGGNAGQNPSMGHGPGGGAAGGGQNGYGGNGSYGAVGQQYDQAAPGAVYGNSYLIPLLGGSGGGGGRAWAGGGGGGGGAILIAADGQITLNGYIYARGGDAGSYGGSGSGGAVRLVAPKITGSGTIDTHGGIWGGARAGGQGRVRFDAYETSFAGSVEGAAFSSGTQFVVLPASGQGAQLRIASVGGVPVSAAPGGVLAVPDVVLSAQQQNPVPIVVECARIPLNTLITVTVKPANAAAVSATAYNDTGTFESSTATVLVNMPRGGGWFYATAPVGN